MKLQQKNKEARCYKWVYKVEKAQAKKSTREENGRILYRVELKTWDRRSELAAGSEI